MLLYQECMRRAILELLSREGSYKGAPCRDIGGNKCKLARFGAFGPLTGGATSVVKVSGFHTPLTGSPAQESRCMVPKLPSELRAGLARQSGADIAQLMAAVEEPCSAGQPEQRARTWQHV